MKKEKIVIIRNTFAAVAAGFLSIFADKIYDWGTLSMALKYATIMFGVGGMAAALGAVLIFFFVED